RQSPADMFTADGALVVHMPGLPVQDIRGGAALEAMFAAAGGRPARSMPAVHNQVISIDGDEALATSWIELHLSDEAADDGRASEAQARHRAAGDRYAAVQPAVRVQPGQVARLDARDPDAAAGVHRDPVAIPICAEHRSLARGPAGIEWEDVDALRAVADIE